MPSAVPFAPHFFDEKAAYAFVEGLLWRDGRVCPHCGAIDRSGKLSGKSTRPGLYKCYGCRKPFTVKHGTLFESSNVKLHLWLRAVYLMYCSKNRIGSPRLSECLEVTGKTAWLLRRRILDAVRTGKFPTPLAAAFVNLRQRSPRKTGMWKKMLPVRRSWSTPWGMTSDHDRFTPLPALSTPKRGTRWGDLTEGAVE